MRIVDTLLQDDDLAHLYLNAILSGDTDNYEWDKESSHPYFQQGLKDLSFDQLRELQQILEGHIREIEEQETRFRRKINWDAPTWDLPSYKHYKVSQGLNVDLERLWHLKLKLQEWIDKKMTQEIVRSGKNLDLDAETLCELNARFGQDLIAVLAAGWFEHKGSAEA